MAYEVNLDPSASTQAVFDMAREVQQEPEVSYVYMLLNIDGKSFKIGKSNAPLRRLGELPEKLDLERSFVYKVDKSYAYAFEKSLQSLFNKRYKYDKEFGPGYTEWFDIEALPRVEEYIQRNRDLLHWRDRVDLLSHARSETGADLYIRGHQFCYADGVVPNILASKDGSIRAESHSDAFKRLNKAGRSIDRLLSDSAIIISEWGPNHVCTDGRVDVSKHFQTFRLFQHWERSNLKFLVGEDFIGMNHLIKKFHDENPDRRWSISWDDLGGSDRMGWLHREHRVIADIFDAIRYSCCEPVFDSRIIEIARSVTQSGYFERAKDMPDWWRSERSHLIKLEEVLSEMASGSGDDDLWVDISWMQNHGIFDMLYEISPEAAGRLALLLPGDNIEEFDQKAAGMRVSGDLALSGDSGFGDLALRYLADFARDPFSRKILAQSGFLDRHEKAIVHVYDKTTYHHICEVRPYIEKLLPQKVENLRSRMNSRRVVIPLSDYLEMSSWMIDGEILGGPRAFNLAYGGISANSVNWMSKDFPVHVFDESNVDEVREFKRNCNVTNFDRER